MAWIWWSKDLKVKPAGLSLLPFLCDKGYGGKGLQWKMIYGYGGKGIWFVTYLQYNMCMGGQGLSPRPDHF